ncbi:Lar family restriction alleviation protein [Limnobaculum xujianqingii]|uniref:Lar family restriction alleviation protein n=1 Tax=Limnobaculum xujianqingii TaxID=2738837 RepID=UPI00112D9E94|nr:Lar family restriction alleviation protein [Limnobaculum xujianqingii]
MKLFIYGNEPGDIAAHGEYQHGVDASLLPCPFCASDELTVDNSWTPYYSVECQCCGASIPGNFEPNTFRFNSKEECRCAHEQAFNSAINCWNSRLEEVPTNG